MVDIIHRIGIKAPLAQVYEAVATAKGIAGWWSKETTGESRLGGAITSRFHGPDGRELGRMTYELTKLDPEKAVHWRFTDGPPEWIGTDVTFELSRDGDQTLILFGHRNWREAVEFTAHCSMKWATFLLSLRQLLETGTGRPSPDDLKIDNWN
ncbi:MAG: SRPBCC family protein [Gammaproteobacteria bacterium]